MNFKYKLMRFMSGRYGFDALFYALFFVAAILSVINVFFWTIWLQLIVDAILVYAFFRVLSRNIDARRRENQLFFHIKTRFQNWRIARRKQKADYTHVYRKCPKCRAVLRLPRRKGKHTTACPKCGNKFRVYVFKA